MDPTRRNTTSSTGSSRRGKREPTPPRRKTWSFKKEAESSPASLTSKLKQETFPVYNLRWEALKEWLENKFPGYSFHERRVNRDVYHFDVPQQLTQEDKNEIMQLKETYRVIVPRVSQSPEPV